MITADDVLLAMMRAEIDKLPADDKQAVMNCAESIRAVVAAAGPLGDIALALTGAESAATET